MRLRETAASRNGKRLTLACLLLLATLLVAGCSLLPGDDSGRKGGTSDEPAAASSQEKPNIVFILTDDMRKDDLAYMPKTKRFIQEQGTTFENSFVTYSLCCPARATFLTGKYAHNHRVLTNAPGDRGGEKRFRELGGDKSTIATWLDNAGYKTSHIGKYMNGYDGTYVPPGWDEWYTFAGRFHINQRLNDNGEIKSYDVTSIEDVLWQKTEAFLKRSSSDAEPFYLQLDTHAPHEPPSFPPTYSERFSDAKAPRTPSFNERKISDKPRWVRSRGQLGQKEQQAIDDAYRDRLRALMAVDDIVGWTVQTLRNTDELENTYIVFTSDNGYHLGEHRLIGKWTPYEEAIRVPLLVRGPGVPAGAHREEMILNNDFAPTFAEIGDARPSEVDGSSFLPLLRGKSIPWRKRFLIESWHTNLPSSPPTYQALRTEDRVYVEYRTQPVERELYDLKTDPYQLRNQYRSGNRAILKGLDSQLSRLVKCSGKECRAAEGW